MSEIIIGIKKDSFILTGDINEIKDNRRKMSNFYSIGAELKDDFIQIPFETHQNLDDFSIKEKQYKLIKKLLQKFDLDEKQTEEAQEVLYDINLENENFQNFSQKSIKIRNNIHEGSDFNDFIEIVSNTMHRELYDQQLLSAYHLAFSQNGCNFSVPGAGKTSIVYGTYTYLKNLPEDNPKKVDRLLIIGPLASFSPWKKEFKKCFNRETSIKELVGVDSKERQNHFLSNIYTEITLISYQSMASEVENIVIFLKKHNVMVVLDEAHKIKNINGGKWANAILEISKYAKSRIILTGTPAPNGYQDLYNLYEFIWPNKNVLGFPAYYLETLNNNKTPSAKENIKTLIENASPFFIRIKKDDLGLPPPIMNDPIYVEMDNQQKLIYDFIEDKYVDSVKNSNNISSFGTKLKKAKLIRLMQCLTNPNLLTRPLDNYLAEESYMNDLGIDDRDIIKTIQEYDKNYIPEKFIKISELVKEIIKTPGPKGKVIIWTIFIDNITSIQAYLNGQGIKSELLYGATPNENENTPEDIKTREKIIDSFHNEDSDFKVIIANPFAVGESISLHEACHNAIYLERNFNASMYMQSKDRIHRYGLKDTDIVNYYFLLTKNSIDEVIHRRLEEKEQLMLEIIEKEEIPLLSMNLDDTFNDENDIKAIIKYYHDKKSK